MKKSKDFTKLYKVGDRVIVNNGDMDDLYGEVTQVYTHKIHVVYNNPSPSSMLSGNWTVEEYVRFDPVSHTKLYKALK